MLLFLASLALAAPCGTPDGVGTALDAAEQAYVSLDAEAFAASLDGAAISLPCLDGPLSVAQAAQLHRLMAVRLFTIDQGAKAAASASAAHALRPSEPYAEELVPDGHPVRELWEAGDGGGAPVEVPAPLAGEVYVDGVSSAPRRATHAHVIQVFDAEGAPVTGGYVFPGDPLPPYSRAPDVAVAQPEPLPTTGAAEKPPGKWPKLVAGASALAFVGGVGSLVAARSVGDDEPPPGSYNEAFDRWDTVRKRTYGGQALIGAGAVGLSVVAIQWGLK